MPKSLPTGISESGNPMLPVVSPSSCTVMLRQLGQPLGSAQALGPRWWTQVPVAQQVWKGVRGMHEAAAVPTLDATESSRASLNPFEPDHHGAAYHGVLDPPLASVDVGSPVNGTVCVGVRELGQGFPGLRLTFEARGLLSHT